MQSTVDRLYDLIVEAGERGVTDKEAEMVLEISNSTIRGARNELASRGRIVRLRWRRISTRRGNPYAQVWGLPRYLDDDSDAPSERVNRMRKMVAAYREVGEEGVTLLGLLKLIGGKESTTREYASDLQRLGYLELAGYRVRSKVLRIAPEWANDKPLPPDFPGDGQVKARQGVPKAIKVPDGATHYSSALKTCFRLTERGWFRQDAIGDWRRCQLEPLYATTMTKI